MKRVDGRINERVRRICRAINKRANDRRKLRTLVVRLQEVLRQEAIREERNGTRAGKLGLQPDDPFDKIMVA